MNSNTRIVFNVTGQTLALRVLQGRPSSGTFKVFTDSAGDDDVVQFEGTATVENVSTTVDATSGAGQANPQKINLTATTNITIGRKYLISEASKSEWVEPIEIVSADYVIARHPLVNAYTTAATFVGTTMTATVDSTWVADEGFISDLTDPNPDYRVRWSYVVGGVTYLAYTFFDLVRSEIGHGVDIDDLDAFAPGLVDTMPMDYKVEQGRPLLEAAWRMVRARLRNPAISTDALRDAELVDDLVIREALVLLAMGGWKPMGFDSASAYLTQIRAESDRFFEQNFLVTLKTKIDIGTTGGADRVADRPAWSK